MPCELGPAPANCGKGVGIFTASPFPPGPIDLIEGGPDPPHHGKPQLSHEKFVAVSCLRPRITNY